MILPRASHNVETLAFVDETGDMRGLLPRIITALEKQLDRDSGPYWGRPFELTSFSKVSNVPSHMWVMAILRDPDQANALGYHALTPDGHPYGRVFTAPTLQNGGTWVDGANSVSQTMSHEMLEILGDDGANQWCDTDQGYQRAKELCDMVESDSYEIDGIAVSNFLRPAFFRPGDAGQLDHLNLQTTRIGDPRPGNYEIRRMIGSDGGNVYSVFGKQYPDWKRALKNKAQSRAVSRGFDITVSATVPLGRR